jgi:hypothetical protein
MLDERQLSIAARRAYERGRLRRGLIEASPAIPMTLLSLVSTHAVGLNLVLGVLLAVTATGMFWRGGGLARGVSPGLIAGALVIIVPVLGRQCAYFCIGPVCWSTCVMACAFAGIGAGVVLAQSWREYRSAQSIAASLTIAALAGAMGCLEIGLTGLVLAGVTMVLSSSALTLATSRRA